LEYYVVNTEVAPQSLRSAEQRCARLTATVALRPSGTPHNSRLYDIFGFQIKFIYLHQKHRKGERIVVC